MTLRGPRFRRNRAGIELIRELKREFTILLVEHDMDAVLPSPTRSGLWSTAAYRPGIARWIRADAGVRLAYLGDEALS